MNNKKKLAMVLRLLQMGAFPKKEALADDDQCFYCGTSFKFFKVVGEHAHLVTCAYAAMEKALRQRLDLSFFDFIAYDEPGVCTFCEGEEKMQPVFGYPADSPAEAYCEKCARKEVEKNIRLAFVASDIFQSLIERYDVNVISDEDMSEVLSDGDVFQTRFGFNHRIILQYFEKKEAGNLEVIFHKTPTGRCLRVMGSGDRVVYAYPDDIAD